MFSLDTTLCRIFAIKALSVLRFELLRQNLSTSRLFLTDDDNFSMGDKIEDVDAESLINIIETDPYVSVFFYDDTKESSKALEHMEDIDDETDVFNIR